MQGLQPNNPLHRWRTLGTLLKSALAAVALGATLATLSLFHSWQGIDTVYRGFPFLFVNIAPSMTGFGPDSWGFLGYRPLVAVWLIWTALAEVCLRVVKGTTSALFGVAAIHCVIGLLDWWRFRDYFWWVNWLCIGFWVSIYILLGVLARRARLTAALSGVGFCAAFLAYQAICSVDMLIHHLTFEIPIVLLVVAAVLLALRRQLALRLMWGGSVLGMTVLCCAAFTLMAVGLRLLPVAQNPRDGIENMIFAGFLGVGVSGTILIALTVFRSKWLDAASELPKQHDTPTAPQITQ